jgi:F-box protein 18 (helicase)
MSCWIKKKIKNQLIPLDLKADTPLIMKMELTTEQHEIINSKGDIKINAIAGSGKTTTIIEYAKTRPVDSKILYLAFNKSVKLEALAKFARIGLKNVRVETTHSLAYKHIVLKQGYKVRSQGYKTNEIAELLKIQGNGEKHAEYIVANHINKFITYFCNSDKQKIEDLNYPDTLTDNKAKVFVNSFYKYIEKMATLLLRKMDAGEIEITHDFYVKKFQLSNPELKYDYILFDEGQDASAAMLDVFLKQKTTKVIVGDTNQQIYSWRFAVNSLEKVSFKTFNLSTSFRFNKDIATLATEVLKYKKYIGQEQPISIIGKGTRAEIKSKAIIARTNLGLLLKVIEYVSEKKVARLYFEGNINSYTYADEGASLYDVLHLYNGKHHLVRDKLIKSMRDLRDLEEYIKKTEDPQLGMMVEIVKKYENEIPKILQTIKQKHVGDGEKEKAEMIFSTVHRSKGMEYDQVELVNDFVKEKKLQDFREKKNTVYTADKLNEEVNLLYVAITRTKNCIHIPEDLLPEGFPASPHIHVIKNLPENEEAHADTAAETEIIAAKEKAYVVEEIRVKHKEAYRPWDKDADEELVLLISEGLNPKEIASHFGRTKGAIESRIRKLAVI